MNKEQKPTFELNKPSDFAPFADKTDAANKKVGEAIASGDSIALFDAFETKRRAVEEWFPELKSDQSH